MMEFIRKIAYSISAHAWKRIAIGFVLFLAPLFLFVQLADEVLERETQPFDEAVLRAINSIESTQIDPIIVAITQLGGVIGVGVLTAGLTLLLVKRRMYRKSAIILASVGGAAIINVLLKAVFERSRPELWDRIVFESSYSFPSGHAMASSALALSLLVVLWDTKYRTRAAICAVVFMLSIGFTRLYLGVHYPTDIIGGWLVSLAWIGVVLSAIRLTSWRKSNSHTKDSRPISSQ